jgi:dTDP-4-amino-4,6-dideoxygalactose transaminase
MDAVVAHQQQRLAKARLYQRHLRDVSGVQLLSREVSDGDPYLEFPLLAEDRDGLFAHLIRNGIDCRKYYYRNCAGLQVFEEFNLPCPNAQYLEEHILMLPLYPAYPERKVAKTVRLIREFGAQAKEAFPSPSRVA